MEPEKRNTLALLLLCLLKQSKHEKYKVLHRPDYIDANLKRQKTPVSEI